MKITIEIHDAWLGRPEDLRKILATIAGLECPPTGAGAGPRRAEPPAHDPREDLEEPFDPEERPRGRNGNGRYPGDDDRSQASDDHRRRGGGPADGRAAAPGLGGQAGARRQGPGDRGRQEAGIPLEDPRLDAPAGRGGVSDGPRPRPHVAVIHTGGGNFLMIPNPMPRALEARGGLRHSDLADADGGRSECPGGSAAAGSTRPSGRSASARAGGAGPAARASGWIGRPGPCGSTRRGRRRCGRW